MNRLWQPVSISGLLLTLALVAVGQTAGQPAIYHDPAGFVVSPLPTVLDAAVYDQTDTDFCVRVNKAWSYALSVGVASPTIDARGLIGGQTCADATYTTPFPSGANGRLLLGNATITVNTMWAVPSGVEVIGLGALSTTITAGSLVTTVIKFGPSAGTFASGYFGIKIRALTVDCHDNSGCTGILNQNAEEGSLVEDVGINNAATGLSLVVGGTKADNSGPYRNITFQYPSCTHCGSSTIGVQLTGTDGGQIIRGLDNITYSGCGTNASTGTAFQIIGAATRISNSTVNCATTGIQIGCSGSGCTPATHNVEVEDVYVYNATTPILANATASNLYFSNITSNETSSSTLLSDMGVAKGLVTTTITLPGPALGFYVRGECCTVVNQLLIDSALATSAPKVLNGSVNLPWVSPVGVCHQGNTGTCTP